MMRGSVRGKEGGRMGGRGSSVVHEVRTPQHVHYYTVTTTQNNTLQHSKYGTVRAYLSHMLNTLAHL